MKIEDKMYVGLRICVCLCVCLGSIAMVLGQPISRGDLLQRERALIVERNRLARLQDSIGTVMESFRAKWDVGQYESLAAFYEDLSQVKEFYESFQTGAVETQVSAGGLGGASQVTTVVTANQRVETNEHLSVLAKGMARLYGNEANFRREANGLWNDIWNLRRQENLWNTEQELLVFDQERYERMNDVYSRDGRARENSSTRPRR